ncbi:Mss4-like protein [Mycena galopus ATCC 62051]|nr:Mss4-like protein [Mycena galopus ATCC 62051]
MSAVSSLVEYRGNCHCGAFKFKLKVPELKQALKCTCSICSKNGYLWTYPWPERDNFTVVEGDENTTLRSYLFGNRMMAHKFCPICGTSVMEAKMPHSTVVGAPNFAINIRTLEDVDFESLQTHVFDGAALLPGQIPQVPEPVDAGPMPEGTTVYNGNCHCGAVAYALSSPVKVTKATSCNCSICWRDAALWIYPETTTVNFKGLESAVEYTFATRESHHGFCKH